jgi:hypothetical protein
MTIEINGMAHVILTVNRFDLARAFYVKLLQSLRCKSHVAAAPICGHDRGPRR